MAPRFPDTQWKVRPRADVPFPLVCPTGRVRRLAVGPLALGMVGMVGGIGASACTDTHYSESRPSRDAGAAPSVEPSTRPDDVALSDAGSRGDASSTAEPPAWAAKLFGDYAVRLRTFGVAEAASIAQVRHETLSIAQVRFDAASGDVSLTVQMCSDRTELPAWVASVQGSVKQPLLYPRRTLRVQFAQGFFYTQADQPQLIGYGAAPLDCSPGQKRMRTAAQPWLLDGQCECPNSTALPTSRADCRVIDSDQDGAPGLALGFTGAFESVDYVVQRDDSQLVRGQVRDDGRHIANYAVNAETYQIECPGGTCTRVAFRSCQPEVNTILFAPLSERADGAMWTCDQAKEMLAPGVLFPADALTFPQTGC